MKSLRRSLHKDAGGQSYNAPTLPTLSKPVSGVVPPKKVIRALGGHRPTAPQELSFAKGDFFYVIRDVVSANGNEYYEAHNPVTGARGLVPKSLFEGFDKAATPQRIVTQAGPGARISTPVSVPRVSGPLSPKPNSVFYAVVLHDFQAERTDELDAKAGDAISVVAHSNREWFVAKPIGKLGGPGLIPASFLEVRDPLTGQAIEDLDALIDRGELPPVEEWKKATMNYKASSIALGVVDSPNAGPVPNSKFQQMALTSPGADTRYPYGAPSPGGNNYQPEPQAGPETFLPEPDLSRLDLAPPLPRGVLVRAEVSSFHFEANDWHFRVNATFKPDPSATNPFDPNPPTSRELTLFRVYDDFYVFQIQLLAAFPVEAGRDPEHPDEPPEEDDGGQSTRILPFMPGPQDDVDETLADSRRHDLDVYLKELVALRDVGADHILRSELVRKFFAAREGDIENEIPSIDQEDDYGMNSKNGTKGYYEDQDRNQRQSEYEDSYDSHSRTNASYSTAPTSQYSKENAHPYARAQTHGRDSSGSGSGHQYERNPDRNRQDDGKYGQSHPYARGQDPSGGAYGGARGGGVPSPTTRYNNPNFGSPKMRNTSPPRAQYPNTQSIVSSRDSEYRGHQTTPSTSTTNVGSGGNPNSPRISSHNSNAAFVKIKIFHSSTDELIAIRVSPRVTLRQLMEKVRERLGNNVENVKYRDGMAAGSGGTGHFVDIMDDAELRDWMASGDKLVLYAE